MPRIVLSNRRLRFDGPHFLVRRCGLIIAHERKISAAFARGWRKGLAETPEKAARRVACWSDSTGWADRCSIWCRFVERPERPGRQPQGDDRRSAAVDTTQPQGRIIFAILATLAEFERE
jgi:hypothetical protein